MSLVTNAVLWFSCNEAEHPDEDADPKWRTHPIIATLNAGHGVRHAGGEFRRVDHLAGGYKAFEGNLYVSAFNYLSEDALIVALHELPWSAREQVELLLRGQEDLTTRVVRLGDDGGAGC